jgi:prophage endopeptidase
MNIIDTVTKPVWLRLLPYVLAVAAVLAALWAAYSFGADVTTEHYQRVMAQHDADNSKALAAEQLRYRGLEQQHAANIAAIDQQHQQAIENEITSRERTIADLRAGAIGLRSKFTTCQRTSGATAPAGTGTSQRDAAASLELQREDATFLVSIASEADRVADQLRSCQAVIRADRAQSISPTK